MDTNPFELILENSNPSGVFLFFQSDGFLMFVGIIKIILIVFTVFFLLHSLYLIYKILRLQGKIVMTARSFKTFDVKNHKGEFLLAWENVQKRLKSDKEADLKLAIIEADKIIDNILKRIMIKGDDMADRLKNVPKDLIPSISGVWESHKIRNRLVHETNFNLNKKEVINVIKNYEVALQELEIL